MEYLSQESGYIFFAQKSNEYKKTVVRIRDLRRLGEILMESFGIGGEK